MKKIRYFLILSMAFVTSSYSMSSNDNESVPEDTSLAASFDPASDSNSAKYHTHRHYNFGSFHPTFMQVQKTDAGLLNDMRHGLAMGFAQTVGHRLAAEATGLVLVGSFHTVAYFYHTFRTILCPNTVEKEKRLQSLGAQKFLIKDKMKENKAEIDELSKRRALIEKIDDPEIKEAMKKAFEQDFYRNEITRQKLSEALGQIEIAEQVTVLGEDKIRELKAELEKEAAAVAA